MSGELLGIATSGLMAFQRSLTTTSHNIVNVDTEGYSRQRADLAAQDANFIGQSGYIGSGVNVASVQRSYDVFLTNQVRTSTSAHSELDAYYQLATQVDNMIADQDSSLSPAMQSFFDAVHGVVNEPTSVPVRRVMLTAAQTMVNRFNVLNENFDNLRDQAYQSMESNVNQLNAQASNLAELNKKIVAATGKANGNPPNDLLDQRDQLLVDMAKHLDVRVIPESNGAVNVFVGSGQALVMGTQAASLRLQDSMYGDTQKDIALVASGSSNSTIVTNLLTGGDIGGMMNFQKDFLDPAQNDLGRIAAAFADQFNTQHRAGFDLNGVAGVDFFFEPSPTVATNKLNTVGSSLTVAYNDFQQMSGADYKVDVTATGVNITNLRTNALTALTVAIPASTFNFEGLDFTLGGVSAGDSFIVCPTRAAAGSLSIAAGMNDPALIAAAATGSATPATAKVGDNTNALALTRLQTTKSLLNGRATYQDAFNEIVGTVGNLTKAAEINSSAQKSLLDQATQQRDSVAGVNLDEEAANLIKFQQAYQAAAQTISAAQSTFDALIGAVRR